MKKWLIIWLMLLLGVLNLGCAFTVKGHSNLDLKKGHHDIDLRIELEVPILDDLAKSAAPADDAGN